MRGEAVQRHPVASERFLAPAFAGMTEGGVL
jgi:hypothetical protein